MANNSSNFSITLDIDKMFEKHNVQYEKMGDYILRGIEKGIEKFENDLLAKLQENLILYGLGSSNLAQTAIITRGENGIYIQMTSEYAMYVEYGTGIVGANFQHPNLSGTGWQYDSNAHGDSGWWYPTDADDPNPTKRFREGSGWWAWTAGQASRPFMYMTWLWGTQSVNNIISGAINNEIKMWERGMK